VLSTASNPKMAIALVAAASRGPVDFQREHFNLAAWLWARAKVYCDLYRHRIKRGTISSATSTRQSSGLSGLSLPENIAAGRGASFTLTFQNRKAAESAGTIS